MHLSNRVLQSLRRQLLRRPTHRLLQRRGRALHAAARPQAKRRSMLRATQERTMPTRMRKTPLLQLMLMPLLQQVLQQGLQSEQHTTRPTASRQFPRLEAQC